MDTQTPKLSYPDRKISETLLHFAVPLLHDLTNEASEQRVEKAFLVAFTAWNAVIFADVLDDHSYLDKIRCVATEEPGVAELVEQLILRKRAFFGDDERLIGAWEVLRTADGFNLRADARDPYTVSKAPE